MPETSEGLSRTDKLKMCLMFLSLGAGAVWFIHRQLNPAPDVVPTPKVETQADRDRDAGMGAVIAARTAVKSMLKDADSAKFIRQFAVKTDKGLIVACGEVNAKNTFGGYAGASVYVMQDGVVRLEGPINANDVRRRWNATCAKFPPIYDKPHL